MRCFHCSLAGRDLWVWLLHSLAVGSGASSPKNGTLLTVPSHHVQPRVPLASYAPSPVFQKSLNFNGQVVVQIAFPLSLLTFLPSYLFSGEVLGGPGESGEVERNTYRPDHQSQHTESGNPSI